MKKKENLKELLNNSFLDLANLTSKCGDLDYPSVVNNSERKIDFFATYSQPSTYFKTSNTCVSFFEYDKSFDGLHGLWNGIYYDENKIKEKFIDRFKDVKLFVAPDYSKCGDSLEAENIYRNMKSRIVAIWLAMNLDASVLPLFSTANYKGKEYMLDGMSNCSAGVFNAKGPIGSKTQLPIFIDSIKYTVDNLDKLKTIYVYTSSPKNDLIYEVFDYAIKNGVNVIIPENTLRIRNRILGGDDNGIN